MRIHQIFLLPFLVLASFSPMAASDPAAIRLAVDQFLRVQTQGLPGTVRYSVGTIAANTQLADCPALDVSLPPGSRLWGQSFVMVKCQAEANWSLYVPVQVRIIADYYVAARNLGLGQSITEADLQRRNGDITGLPTGVLTSPGEAIGRTTSQAIVAGRPLRSDMLKQPFVVQQGQNVRVSSKGPGFQVTNDGRALGNAVDGQVVQVRLNNGQILSGVARPGAIVEIGF
ncbi:MAG: flagellar basal body P-ring formation protein FlgA [Rhodocyclaceae bacterium]|nr:flagellar basal body P-ring formation protein FlgA [Rhodocyclaceae bacterium]